MKTKRIYLILSPLVVLFLVVSCVSEKKVCRNLTEFRKKHPLAQYSPEDIANGKISEKMIRHWRNFVPIELSASNEKLINSIKAKYGDFG